MGRHSDVMRRLAAARPASLDPVDSATRREPDPRAATLSSDRSGGTVGVVFASPHAADSSDPGRPGLRGRGSRRGPSTHRRSRGWLAPVVAATATGAVIAAVAMLPDAPTGRGGQVAAASGARALALAMADRTERLPPEGGRYWHTHALSTSREDVVGPKRGGYSVTVRREIFKWTPGGRRDDFKDDANVYGRLAGFRPLAEADEAAWRAAGSPARIRTSERVPGATEAVTKGTGDWRPNDPFRSGRVTPLGTTPDGPGVPTDREMQKLPTDPVRLRAEVFCPRTGPGAGPGCEPRRVLADVYGAMETNPVPPVLRAAMIRMLVNEPRVTPIGRTTDPLGRPGVGFAVSTTNPDGMVVRELAIFDERTGQALASPAFVVRSGNTSPLKPGDLLNVQALLDVGWTQERPTLPK